LNILCLDETFPRLSSLVVPQSVGEAQEMCAEQCLSGKAPILQTPVGLPFKHLRMPQLLHTETDGEKCKTVNQHIAFLD